MRLKSIASGSSGNAIFVGSDTTNLLVDVGISLKRIEAGLNELELSGKDIDGILITHEHSDHIGGLGVISRKYGIPVYATEGTAKGIGECKSIGKFDFDLINIVKADAGFRIKDIDIKPIRTSHDAYEPVAYRFECEKKKSAIITDLGTFDDYTVSNLEGLDALFIEANHDVRMLQLGRYPYQLKQRILGNRGHLSNEASGRLLSLLIHDNMKHIVLSHLSHENNMPELAYEAVRLEVTMADNPYRGDDFDIIVAKRDEPTKTLTI